MIDPGDSLHPFGYKSLFSIDFSVTSFGSSSGDSGVSDEESSTSIGAGEALADLKTFFASSEDIQILTELLGDDLKHKKDHQE